MAEQKSRKRLDQRAVVSEAIAFADEEGLEAVSMRALAARLGVVPMALYRHVADKDDLLGRMIDQIIEGYTAPPAGGTWRERVRFRVMNAQAEILAHPWLGAAIDSAKRRTEAVLAHMNAVSGEFIDGGVSPDLTHYAMHALGNRMWGYSTEAFEDADAPTPKDVDQPDVEQYMTQNFPHVVAIAMDSVARNPTGSCDRQTEFEFTLDLLLDSFERLHEAGWVSRPLRS